MTSLLRCTMVRGPGSRDAAFFKALKGNTLCFVEVSKHERYGLVILIQKGSCIIPDVTVKRQRDVVCCCFSFWRIRFVAFHHDFDGKMNRMSGLWHARCNFSNNISLTPHNDLERYIILFSLSLGCEN